MLINRMRIPDTKKEISIPKRRLRPPRYHKKDISIPKKMHPVKTSTDSVRLAFARLVSPFSSKTPLFGGDAPRLLRRPPRWNNASQGMTSGMGVGGVVFGRAKPHRGIRMKASRSLREGKDGKIGEREREREKERERERERQRERQSTTQILRCAKTPF